MKLMTENPHGISLLRNFSTLQQVETQKILQDKRKTLSYKEHIQSQELKICGNFLKQKLQKDFKTGKRKREFMKHMENLHVICLTLREIMQFASH